MEEKYKKIKELVEKELSCRSHNIDHILRVYRLSLQLAKSEGQVDLDILKTASLLHDIARVREDHDHSGKTDHAILGAEMPEKILLNFNYPEDKIGAIKHCIITHRFRSGNKPESIEAKILFEADKLDILGSVGIARLFVFTGQFGQRMHSNVKINEYVKENFVGGKLSGRIKSGLKHTPNLEFETKLKYIPERLYTKKAREIGKERVKFMENFFKKFGKEMKGDF